MNTIVDHFRSKGYGVLVLTNTNPAKFNALIETFISQGNKVIAAFPPGVIQWTESGQQWEIKNAHIAVLSKYVEVPQPPPGAPGS